MPEELCELCGKKMDAQNCYIVRIDVFADPSMPTTTSAELQATDFDAEIDDLLDQMKEMTAAELQDQVHRRFELKICPKCQPGFLANPLGKPRSARVGDN
jgi:hypothetical protein